MELEKFLQHERHRFHSKNIVHLPQFIKNYARFLIALIILIFIVLILIPWIQTAFGSGNITTLNPHDRQQYISALISGRIKRWYVQEGDMVKKGQIILEMVDNDPDLINRLTEKMQAQKYTYEAKNTAARTELLNYERQKKLFKQSLASRLEVERAKISYNKAVAARENAEVQLQSAKSELSRQQTQEVIAPADGIIVQIRSGGLATSVKKDDVVATLVPQNVPLAVELYISGLDVALMKPGLKVRLQFEGWPAVQFSGWPSIAFGTFGGIVHAVDPSISQNGKFRILIKPELDDVAWPDERFLRYGAKVKGWVLLDTVPLGYELWRQLNAFPPEYTYEDKKEFTYSSGKSSGKFGK
ncbi:MAG: HlyD family efflux transporter periplasmic adaptor subunit [Pseudomonadota bacterium]